MSYLDKTYLKFPEEKVKIPEINDDLRLSLDALVQYELKEVDDKSFNLYGKNDPNAPKYDTSGTFAFALYKYWLLLEHDLSK
jgi:hypothetical protein